MEQYYKAEHLANFGKIAEGSDRMAKKFFEYYNEVFSDGDSTDGDSTNSSSTDSALTSREKTLIALAVAHALQCPYCIDAYSQECLKQGSDLEQMTEAVHVATAIRGGAALVHGLQMLEHVNKATM